MIRILFLALIAIMLTSCQEVVVEKIAQAYKDGKPQVINIFNEDESEKIGYRAYHENGNVSMEGGFSQDKRHGQWNSYFFDGGLWTVNNYDLGEFHGEYLMYNKNGSIRIRGSYVQGAQTGTWTVTDEEGKVVKKDDFGPVQ